jgi:hypothetical protein
MDLVQKEHDRLQKRLKASQGIKNVQSTIDLLQQARDAIAEGQLTPSADCLSRTWRQTPVFIQEYIC